MHTQTVIIPYRNQQLIDILTAEMHSLKPAWIRTIDRRVWHYRVLKAEPVFGGMSFTLHGYMSLMMWPN